MSLSLANLHGNGGMGGGGGGGGAVGGRWLGMRRNRDRPPHILSGLLDQAMVDDLCLELVRAAENAGQLDGSSSSSSSSSSDNSSRGGSSDGGVEESSLLPPRKRARHEQPGDDSARGSPSTLMPATGSSLSNGDGGGGLGREQQLSPTTGALMCAESVENPAAPVMPVDVSEIERELAYRRQERGACGCVALITRFSFFLLVPKFSSFSSHLFPPSNTPD